MDDYVVIHRVKLSGDESKKAITGGVDIPALMVRRGAVCFAAIKESDFMAVAKLHAMPEPPERMAPMPDTES